MNQQKTTFNDFVQNKIVQHYKQNTKKKTPDSIEYKHDECETKVVNETDLLLLNYESIEDNINSVRACNNFVQNKIVQHYKQNRKKKKQILLNTKTMKVKQKLSMMY